jgi:hypothetical protein
MGFSEAVTGEVGERCLASQPRSNPFAVAVPTGELADLPRFAVKLPKMSQGWPARWFDL